MKCMQKKHTSQMNHWHTYPHIFETYLDVLLNWVSLTCMDEHHTCKVISLSGSHISNLYQVAAQHTETTENISSTKCRHARSHAPCWSLD